MSLKINITWIRGGGGGAGGGVLLIFSKTGGYAKIKKLAILELTSLKPLQKRFYCLFYIRITIAFYLYVNYPFHVFSIA